MDKMCKSSVQSARRANKMRRKELEYLRARVKELESANE
jgi:hypothetical protein